MTILISFISRNRMNWKIGKTMTACVLLLVRSYQVTINVYGSSQTPFQKKFMKRRHSNVDLLKESWKKTFRWDGNGGETYGSFVDTNQSNQKKRMQINWKEKTRTQMYLEKQKIFRFNWINARSDKKEYETKRKKQLRIVENYITQFFWFSA